MNRLLLPILLLLAGSALAPAQNRKLDVSFLFHFNQDLVPYGVVANEASYIPLTTAMLDMAHIPFSVQISGTLLHNLLWHNDTAIHNLKTMVERGQVELFGSTYSQNVMVATGSDWLNRAQMDLHKQLYRQVFGVENLSGFWNPERVWEQNLTHLVAGAGYRYLPVEHHILLGSGKNPNDRSVSVTRAGSDSLFVLHDDAVLRHFFNQALNTRDAKPLIDYLRTLYEADTADSYLTGFYDDAESVGLWQYEGGVHPDTTIRNFRELMQKLAGIPWLQLTTPSRFFEQNGFAATERTPIVRGEAAWMITHVANLGYDSWFDYRELDEVQRHFDALFATVRDSMDAGRQLFRNHFYNDALVTLYDRMLLTYTVHEYEYGASWAWHKEDGSFNMVREALVPLRAMRHVLHPADTVYIEDINLDGVAEVVLANAAHFLIFTPYGGRLLYWFDLKTGRSYIGNENFNYYDEKYRPGNPFEPEVRGGRQAYNWLKDNPLLPHLFDQEFALRRTALADVFEDSLMLGRWTIGLSAASVKMTWEGSDYAVDKTVWIDTTGPVVEYRIDNTGNRRFNRELRVYNTLSPALPELMDGGSGVLQADGLSVANQRAGVSARMEFTGGGWTHTGRRVIFGWETESRLGVGLRANQSTSFQLKFYINE